MTASFLSDTRVADPSTALRFRDRQYAADLIAMALLEFDLFTHLDRNPGVTAKALCETFQWHARPTDVLLTLCRASGFIVDDGSGGCRLTDSGREYLVSDSPAFLGPYYQPIADSPILQGYLKIFQTGKPANWQAKSDGADWHESMKDPEFAKNFTALMNCRGIPFGKRLAETITPYLADRKHLLDVGGGSGIYATTMVARHPGLVATVLEQPPVDAIAVSEIARHGLSDRVGVVSRDMFTDAWSSDRDEPIDMILLSNLLHDWDIAEAQSIVDHAYQELPTGGMLIIHGALVDEDKSGPLPVAEYSALLMNITQGKCYSIGEYHAMMTQAGFVPGPSHDTTGDRGYVTGFK